MRCLDCVLLQEANALVVQNSDHSTTAYPSFLFFYGLETDGESNSSAIINSGYRLEFVNADMSNTSCTYSGQGCNDGATVQINNDSYAGTRQIRFVGGRVGNSRQAALSMSGGNEVSLLGTTFNDASKAGAGTNPTVIIYGGDHIWFSRHRSAR